MDTSALRHRFFMSWYKYRDLIVAPVAFTANIPFVTRIGAKFPVPTRPPLREVHLSYIPISETIETPPGVAAPIQLIEEFIEMSTHRVSLKYCPCRTIEGCKDYPKDIGCTFLGASTRDISPEFADHISKEEAIEKLHRAQEAGLLPLVGRALPDALLVAGINNHSHMLTICHCCPCCCPVKYTRDVPKELHGLLNFGLMKLEGVTVEVTDACTGCGKCVDKCLFGMIEVVDRKAQIGEFCRGCGSCAHNCPESAIKLSIDNSQYYDRAKRRITSLYDSFI